jgi:single-strand selective monofunctional uracil DNA glycosylase
LRESLADFRFAAPVSHVYDPLDYAWDVHRAYLERFATSPKRVVFLGMNPGPYGMMQTGVPFGEVAAVRDWMKLEGAIHRPSSEHPKRPIQGFACSRSEVSGRRVWAWAAERYGSATEFFHDHFVLNFCPLVFLEESGRNYTPDKLPVAQARPLEAACQAHLETCLKALQPQWLIGFGGFAYQRLAQAHRTLGSDLHPQARVMQVLHPSPASPAANRGWAQAVQTALDQALVP